MVRKVPVSMVLLLLAGCGADSGVPGDVPDEKGLDLIHIFDQGGPPLDADPGYEAGFDTPGDTADQGPSVGQKGWPCTHHSGCQSGHCAETPAGLRCTVTCGTDMDCDSGLVCGPATLQDSVFFCLHPAPRRCQPCLDSDTCRVYHLLEEAVMNCVDMGGFGRCLQPCQGANECPSDHECGPVGDTLGPDYCLPQSGECTCSALAQDIHLPGFCTLTNDLGTCFGTFHCGEDGASACAGSEPEPDLCNGQDDDCDSETDEAHEAQVCHWENSYGSCQGSTACVEGAVECQAMEPAPEACNSEDDDCNGQTDEGFPNQDKDELADCVDPDLDGDGTLNGEDNCPEFPNPDQANTDGDEQGDLCDLDDDGDGVFDAKDNCPLVVNADQADADDNGVGDACDGDGDGDGVGNDLDNCPWIVNGDQSNLDGDAMGDACDKDMDGDGKDNGYDNCPEAANGDQKDTDGDGFGDACDWDDDNDSVADAVDNCPLKVNLLQQDMDGDKLGDECDPDMDGDGRPNELDNCPGAPNPGQEDLDENGVGDACEPDLDGDGVPNDEDLCPAVPDPDQGNVDGDELGDACDCDIDGDTALNPNLGCLYPPYPDNCPFDFNTTQGDMDDDGLGDACDPDRDGDGVANGEDCEPDDSAVYPGHVEICNGKDDNCDGDTDGEGSVNCLTFFPDQDEDGYGGGDGKCLCGPSGLYTSLTDGDCDLTDPAVNPGEPEACTSKDDNCDGKTDPDGALGCQAYYADGDEDGWGTPLQPARCLCQADPAQYYTADKTGDCKDWDPKVNPGMMEICNDMDDDCDGATDGEGASGCAVYYPDGDQDGYGAIGDGKCLCTPFGIYDTLKTGDCDDQDAEVHKDATEACDGKDTDCDGDTDEIYAAGCTFYYTDGDKDGYGVSPLTCLCAPTEDWTTTASGDCDDGAPESHPGADEVCDGKDNDCDGTTDEEC